MLTALGMLVPGWLRAAGRARAVRDAELRRLRTLMTTGRLPALPPGDARPVQDTRPLSLLAAADLPLPIYEAAISVPGRGEGHAERSGYVRGGVKGWTGTPGRRWDECGGMNGGSDTDRRFRLRRSLDPLVHRRSPPRNRKLPARLVQPHDLPGTVGFLDCEDYRQCDQPVGAGDERLAPFPERREGVPPLPEMAENPDRAAV